MVDVDVKVFTDQIREKKLDPKTERRIRKLLGNNKRVTQQQAGILQSIIDDALASVTKASTMEELGILASINIFGTGSAIEKLVPYQSNIAKAFQFGIQFSNDTPSKLVRQLEEGVKQSAMTWITKMGDDIKEQAGQIISDGFKQGLDRNTVASQLEQQLNVTRARANTIARTETMRASHAGSYGQAIRDGAQYYIIDSRAEACDLCLDEYDGVVFSIDDPSNMPPLHPNCACIPVYFDKEQDATEWSNMISDEIAQERQAIEDTGKTISPDGTGSETNKVDSSDRRHN